MKNIRDAVFGEMSYNSAWEKKEKLFVFDNEIEFDIIASAFEDELIEPTQRVNYKYFKENIDTLFVLAIEALENYCDENAEEIIEALQQNSGVGVEDIIPENPLELIELTGVFFDRYNNFAIIGEVDWDEENGIAIMFNSDGTIEVGFQDIIF